MMALVRHMSLPFCRASHAACATHKRRLATITYTPKEHKGFAGLAGRGFPSDLQWANRVHDEKEAPKVRFRTDSSECDVRGLTATTSVCLRDKIKPDKICERVEAVGQVRKNLTKHIHDYPAGVTRTGT